MSIDEGDIRRFLTTLAGTILGRRAEIGTKPGGLEGAVAGGILGNVLGEFVNKALKEKSPRQGDGRAARGLSAVEAGELTPELMDFVTNAFAAGMAYGWAVKKMLSRWNEIFDESTEDPDLEKEAPPDSASMAEQLKFLRKVFPKLKEAMTTALDKCYEELPSDYEEGLAFVTRSIVRAHPEVHLDMELLRSVPVNFEEIRSVAESYFDRALSFERFKELMFKEKP